MGTHNVTARRYLLDACVGVYFQRAGQLELLAHSRTVMPWAIVDVVEDELTRHKVLGAHAYRVLQQHHIPVVRIGRDTPEHALLEHLHPSDSQKDLGEAASIAAASHDASLIFVSHEPRALRIALKELYSRFGERCVHTSTFVRRLAERGALQADHIKHWARCNPLPDMPHWWKPWVDAQTDAPPPAAAA